MLKANELRTGNLVMQYGIDYDSGGNKFRDTEGDEIYKVMAISGGNISTYYYDKLIQINLVDIEPIPLTEEWLLRFGFDNTNLYYEISVGLNSKLSIVKSDFSWCVGIPYESGGSDLIIKYVHQLQNLYFALTGEELNVNKL